MMRAAFFISAVLFANPASAQDMFVELSSCSPLYTVVYDNCEVSNFYTCPEGSIMEVSIDFDTPPLETLTSAEWEPLRVGAVDSDDVMYLEEIITPFSLENLLSGEVEKTEARMVGTMAGLMMDSALTVTMELTGDVLKVSGFDLLEIDSRLKMTLGFAGNQAKMTAIQYFEPSNQIFIAGPSRMTFGGEVVSDDPEQILRIARDGDADFMRQTPATMCGPQVSLRQGAQPYVQGEQS